VIFTAAGEAAAALVYQPDHAAHYRRRVLLISAFYLWACAFAKRRHLTIKGQRLVLPSASRCCRWRFPAELDGDGGDYLAAVGQQVNYFLVLGVLLVSSIAGVIVHIPAGIGVLEAVFIAMLSGKRFRAARLSPPCSPTRALLLPAAAAGDHRLSDSGESGEKLRRKTSASWRAREKAVADADFIILVFCARAGPGKRAPRPRN
jgi:hypothetical protein